MQRALRGAGCPAWLSLAGLLCHFLCCYDTVGLPGGPARPAPPAVSCPARGAFLAARGGGGLPSDAFSLAWGLWRGDAAGTAPEEGGGDAGEPAPEEEAVGAGPQGPDARAMLALIWSLPAFLLFLLLPYMCGHGTGPSWLFRVVLAWALAWTCGCMALVFLAGLPHMAWCVAMHSFSAGCTAVRAVVQGRGWGSVDVQAREAWNCPGALVAALNVSCLLVVSCMRGSSVSAYDDAAFYSNHLVAHLAVQALGGGAWRVLGPTTPRDDRATEGVKG